MVPGRQASATQRGHTRRTAPHLSDGLECGKPQPRGQPDFRGAAVFPDGQRIAGRNAAGKAVIFNRQTQNLQIVPGIAPDDQIRKWTKDGDALLVNSATPSQSQMFRVDAATGKRLQKVELNNQQVPARRCVCTMPKTARRMSTTPGAC